jgi:hypothetical protein
MTNKLKEKIKMDKKTAKDNAIKLMDSPARVKIREYRKQRIEELGKDYFTSVSELIDHSNKRIAYENGDKTSTITIHEHFSLLDIAISERDFLLEELNKALGWDLETAPMPKMRRLSDEEVDRLLSGDTNWKKEDKDDK